MLRIKRNKTKALIERLVMICTLIETAHDTEGCVQTQVNLINAAENELNRLLIDKILKDDKETNKRC